MSWDHLEAALRTQAEQLARGDVYTAPADGSPPSRCPLCYAVLLWRAPGDAVCPYAHYRWPGG